jgi:hypothetical protein
LRHCATNRGSRFRFLIGFFIGIILPVALYTGVDLASNRNEYLQYVLGCKGGRCIGLTTLTPSYSNCLEILEPRPPGNLRACPGLQWECFIFTFRDVKPKSNFIRLYQTVDSYLSVCLLILLFIFYFIFIPCIPVYVCNKLFSQCTFLKRFMQTIYVLCFQIN